MEYTRSDMCERAVVSVNTDKREAQERLAARCAVRTQTNPRRGEGQQKRVRGEDDTRSKNSAAAVKGRAAEQATAQQQ